MGSDGLVDPKWFWIVSVLIVGVVALLMWWGGVLKRK